MLRVISGLFLIKRLEEFEVSLSDEVQATGFAFGFYEGLQFVDVISFRLKSMDNLDILFTNDFLEEALNTVPTVMYIVFSVSLEPPVHALVVEVGVMSLFWWQFLDSLLELGVITLEDYDELGQD